MDPLSSGGGGGVDMPPWNIRNSIAVKVAAKKTAKGYVVSDELCAACEMPLLELHGKAECKTCPAIAKWVQRQKEASSRDEGRTDVKEVPREARDEVEERAEEACQGREGALEAADSDETEDTEAIRRRARQIILEARRKGGWGVEEEEEEEAAEEEEAEEESVASPTSVPCAEEEEEEASKQLMMESLTADSSVPSWDGAKVSYSYSKDDDSTVGISIEDRAADIIRRARENLKAELGAEARDLLSPRAAEAEDSPRTMDPPKDEVLRMKRLAAAIAPRADPPRANVADEPPHAKSIDKPPVEDSPRTDPPNDVSPRVEPLANVVDEAPLATNSIGSFSLDSAMFSSSLDEVEEEHPQEEEDVEDKYVVDEDVVDEDDDEDDEDDEDVEDEEDDEEVFGENIQSKVEVVESTEKYEPLGVVDDHTGDEEDADDAYAEDFEDAAEEQKEEDYDAQYEEDRANGKEAPKATSQENGIHHNISSQASESAHSVQRQAAASRQWQQQQHVHMRHSVQQGPSYDSVVPSRGLFANIACKFDDAVTQAMGKVHKVISCEMEIPGVGFPEGFGDAFEAEQGQDAAGRAYEQVSKAKYEAQIMLLNLRGWKIANGACNRCDKAWMVNPEDGTLLCAACDDVESNLAPVKKPEVVQPIAHTPAAMPSLHDVELDRRLQMGWVATNEGCPHCHSQMVRKRGEAMDHCIACGPIFTPAHAPAMTPSMPALSAYTPLSVHPNIAATPNANPVQDVTESQRSKPSADVPLDPRKEGATTPPAANVQALMKPYSNILGQIQTMQTSPLPQDDDAKENAPGSSNVNKELDEARRRIEDAKKFILSRSSQRRLATKSAMTPNTRALVAQAQEGPFANVTPSTNASTLGSKASAAAPLTTQGSGYATPQMPGRYFFA